jgi:arylsulfatase A-like enzyme
VGFSDHLLGRLVERLREVGVYDRALIVVTSDHGAAFIPGQQRRNLKAANLGEVLPVPLFVKLPGQGPTGARDRISLTIDILPTIADVVGARIPWPVDGHSLLRDSTQRDSVYVKVSAQQEKGALRLGVPELLAERDDAAARRQARWHSGSWTSVFQYGPREFLVGRKVAELAVVGRAPSGIIVRRQDPPENERSFTPILMSGVAVGDAGRQPLDLAIALHGTIRATARTYRQVGEAGGMVWQVLIEESALRPGPNPSEIFVVEGPDDSPRLLRVGRPSQSDLHE